MVAAWDTQRVRTGDQKEGGGLKLNEALHGGANHDKASLRQEAANPNTVSKKREHDMREQQIACKDNPIRFRVLLHQRLFFDLPITGLLSNARAMLQTTSVTRMQN